MEETEIKTFFGTLLHRLYTANIEHLIWFGAVVVIMIILGVLHHRWKGDDKKKRLWRMLCLLPSVIAAFHAFIYLRGCSEFLSGYFPLYIVALSALLPVPFAGRKIGYKITAVIVGLVTCVFSFYFLGMSPFYFNHSRETYTAAFRSLVEDMDRYYILKEWKEVDFDALEEKYLPMVQEAEQEQDEEKYADAIMMFCCELHDGHVRKSNDSVSDDQRTADTISKLKSRYISVLLTLEEDVPDLGMSVKANADRVAAMVLSGIGGETVDVSFIDKSSKEQTVTLADLGGPHTQLEAFRSYRHFEKLGDEDEYQSLVDENFSTKMLDDKCGYLRVSQESSGSGFYDIFVGYMTGNHANAREMFREKLRGLKEQGMEYLVIDLRNNDGGYDEIANALCELFSTEDLDHYAVGLRKNGNYKSTAIHGIHGDGEFADLKVVALTNFGCLSAGDGASLYLSNLSNVTLAGLTDPYGCNQETGGVSVLSGGHVCVGFPVGLVLDGNGDPNIDTRADRISRNPVEERIPLDYDAAMKIFRDKEDYELEWAIQYLEKR